MSTALILPEVLSVVQRALNPGGDGGGPGGIWLLSAAAATAVLGVLCPDLYAGAVDHVVTTFVGHH
ncbi:hypothetical protein [Streptomyces mirabilis]|uniref:hypothetical protein n=1 Tax=Streptomyces mirabilis TaxID=68239 RepID=UPI003BEEFE53